MKKPAYGAFLKGDLKKNIVNLVELKDKTSLQSVLKGDLPTRSFFCILGESFMGGGVCWTSRVETEILVYIGLYTIWQPCTFD